MYDPSDGISARICVDIDGVLVDFVNCKEDCDYFDYPKKWKKMKRLKCPVMEGAVEGMRRLKARGLYIIVYTSRVEKERAVTERWLRLHDIPYDELAMGKPSAFMYLDDRAANFKSWDKAFAELDKRYRSIVDDSRSRGIELDKR